MLKSINTTALPFSAQATTQRRQNKTIMDKHIANMSEIRNILNAAFFMRSGVPLSSTCPPGTVNAAVKVIVAKSAAVTPIVSAYSFI